MWVDDAIVLSHLWFGEGIVIKLTLLVSSSLNQHKVIAWYPGNRMRRHQPRPNRLARAKAKRSVLPGSGTLVTRPCIRVVLWVDGSTPSGLSHVYFPTEVGAELTPV